MDSTSKRRRQRQAQAIAAMTLEGHVREGLVKGEAAADIVADLIVELYANGIEVGNLQSAVNLMDGSAAHLEVAHELARRGRAA